MRSPCSGQNLQHKNVTGKFALAVVLLLLVGTLAPALSKRLSRAELAERAAKAVQLSLEAEVELSKQMTTVARWLNEFHQRYYHYPQSPQEIEFFQRRLGKLLPANPFLATPPPSMEEKTLVAQHLNMMNEQDEPVRLKISLDPALTEARLSQLVKEPPGNWFTDPGAISVVNNGMGLCAVWAGGFDGRPIRDSKNGQTIIYIVR